jgi:hypothetical protein
MGGRAAANRKLNRSGKPQIDDAQLDSMPLAQYSERATECTANSLGLDPLLTKTIVKSADTCSKRRAHEN